MPRADEKTLLKFIKFAPISIVLLFSLVVTYIVITGNVNKVRYEIESTRSNFITSQKELIRSEVNRVYNQIAFEKSRSLDALKGSIQERIYEAHAIATEIYKSNQDKAPDVVIEIIKNALRTIRFNNGRGYFFVYDMQGKNILHPILPHLEGKDLWGYQDVKGAYVVQDMGRISKQQGEGFYTWWWVKPQNKKEQFEKVGFGKYFEPYDWFIGTGEYVVDFENDIKERLLESFNNIRFGKNGYIFVIDQSGKILAHYNQDYLGTNKLELKDTNGFEIVKEAIQVAQEGEGYIQYVDPLMPSTGRPAEKISFVKEVAEWDWVVGSGTYISEIENYLAEKRAVIESDNAAQVVKISTAGFVIAIILIMLSISLSRGIERRFHKYRSRIEKDFTDLESARDQLRYMAHHDALTDLPNRSLLLDRVQQGLYQSQSCKTKLAVLFLDLDDFKKVNDLYGHHIGDELLVEIANRLSQVVDEGDSVSRFGGDEFVFSFPLINSLAEAEQKVERIIEAFKAKFVIQGKEIYSTCSIGISLFPDDAQVAEELFAKADIALYKSKALQKGCFLFFNDELNRKVKRDLLIESALRSALKRNEFTLVYQPQISSPGEQVVGVEVLLRWNHSELGAVSPLEFIPIAEDIGAIVSIGYHVLEEACRFMGGLIQQTDNPIKLSVNLSPKQLTDNDFCDRVLAILDQTGFPGKHLTLEITENLFISDVAKCSAILETLRQHEISISLDDFGTGYSSLSYINQLPINEIKIDRAFICQLIESPQSQSLVKTILAIAQACEMNVVAEGVETRQQHQKLIDMGCAIHQGYYFYQPMPSSELSHILLNGPATQPA
ncbi:MAG: cache domain-containing protein [Sedimenticola sp.]|nr:cache domain-containing protein [Sedimenticola sp.]